MIPAEAYTPLLRITFSMIALRRGQHWQLQRVPAEATPFGEPLDEAELLAEGIAGVMKHVPLPSRELGIISDLTTCAIAFYATLGPRLQVDAEIRRQVALRSGAAQPARTFVAPAEGPAAENGDAARMMGDLARDNAAPIRARVETMAAPDRVQTGDTVDDGVQLGRAPTQDLAANEDPEPVLFDAFRPGETPARVEDLVEPGGEPLLDRIAPVIEVDGEPAARELDV